MRDIPEVVVRAQDPYEVIPALLEHLQSLGQFGRRKANWIGDVYSEILKDMEHRRLRDSQWLDDLLDVLCKQLNAVAQLDRNLKHYHFGEYVTGVWGWRPTTF